MKTIFGLIVNIMLLILPILFFFFYSAYKRNSDEKVRDYLLDISLFLSLLLSMKCICFLNNGLFGILVLTPLLISFIYKKTTVSILMSLITFEFINNLMPGFTVLLIVLFITHYIAYYIYMTSIMSTKLFKNIFLILTTLNFLTYHFLKYSTIKNIDYKYVILSLFIFYLTVILIDFTITKSKEILNLYMTLKEVEHEKQVQESLFKITHEIKNPLGVIKGYLDMFDSNNVEKSIKYINIIKEEIGRTLNILDDFKEFTKIKIIKEYTNFSLVLDDIKVILEPLFQNKNIIFNMKCEESLCLYMDSGRIKQVLINLIKNSIESLDKLDNIITLTAFKDKNNVIVIIKDNGCGMDKETLEKIKVPFYTTKEKGTGLGVCFSYEILRAHKGKMIYNSILGKETVIKLILPIN
ncbi:MAG: ATP-binding protein [Bacilli bacterium]